MSDTTMKTAEHELRLLYEGMRKKGMPTHQFVAMQKYLAGLLDNDTVSAIRKEFMDSLYDAGRKPIQDHEGIFGAGQAGPLFFS